MNELALEGSYVLDGRPLPVVEAAAGVDEDVAFFEERVALLPFLGFAVASDQIASVSLDDLDSPLLAVFVPDGADNLMRGLDIFA